MIGLVIGTGLYVKFPPAYHATATVLLVYNGNVNPSVQVANEASMAESHPVAARVVRELKLPQSVASFQAAYTVTVVTDNVLTINVGAPSSAAAVQRASAVATAFLQYRAQYARCQEQQQYAQLQQQYNAAQQRLQVLNAQCSQLPSPPSTPAQKAEYNRLQTQITRQGQILQFVTGYRVDDQDVYERHRGGQLRAQPRHRTPALDTSRARRFTSSAAFSAAWW